MSPCAIASRLTRAWSLSEGSKGRLLARSRTNSIAQKSPRPRMSPTCRFCPTRSSSRRSSRGAHLDDVGEKPVAPDDVLHRERRRRGHRMAHIGVSVLERARTIGESVEDPLRYQHGADRLVAAAQALGDRHQIGRHALLLAGVQGSRPAMPHITSSRISKTP